MSPSGSILGHAVLRREDPKILEARRAYFDDLPIDGLLHVVFVRSTIAHAEITAVDTSEATGLPGVVGVYSGDDLDLAPIQGFVMLPPVFAPSAVREGAGALRRRHRRRGRRRDPGPGGRRGRAGDRRLRAAPDGRGSGGRARRRRAAAVPGARLEPRDRVRVRRGADRLRRRRRRGRASASSTSASPRCRWRATASSRSATARADCSATSRPRTRTGSCSPLAEATGLAEEQIHVIAPAVGGGFGAKAGMYVEFADRGEGRARRSAVP